MSTKESFSVSFAGHNLKGDIMPPGAKPNLLFLHGAGSADRKRFDRLREILVAKGISSAAFDFIGHGETGGELGVSSLRQRTEQALQVIRECELQAPLSIVAASMSGYTAIKISETVPILNLVLLAPAMYAAEAHDLKFGPEFSAVIRKNKSWENSDIWESLEKFTGNLLIFAAENDQVIPKELIQKLYLGAIRAKSKKVITIPGATHPLGKYLEEHPSELENAAAQIIELFPES